MTGPPGSQLCTIDLAAAQVYAGDSSCIGDVVEGIRVEHNEVGAFTRRDRSQVIEAEDFCRRPRGRYKDLGRRQTGGNHVFELRVHGPTDELIALLSAAVRAHADLDARGAEPRNAACKTVPGVLSA